jgi:hypothetical protein
MKVVAKLYYFSPKSPIKYSFVNFECDINICVFERGKLTGFQLYQKHYYKLRDGWTKDENMIKFLFLNERFLTRTNQDERLNEIKNSIGYKI